LKAQVGRSFWNAIMDSDKTYVARSIV